MLKLYILDGHTPVHEPDKLAWAAWRTKHNAERQVAADIAAGALVQTMFVGIDYNFGRGEPHVFETTVFNECGTSIPDRYATWDAAAAGHAEVVARLQANFPLA
jgi:hypothetical protein